MKNSTYIGVVLDRSGSMSSIETATRDGYNEFLRGQKALPDECNLLLAQFDHEYAVTYDGPIAGAPLLDKANYVPRGCTALLDAIGSTLETMGARLAAMAEDQRPAKILVVIITDGEENASSRFTRTHVFNMITHQRDVYKWQFLFLGAGQDAIGEAVKYGIAPTAAASFVATAASVGSTYSVTNSLIGALRTSAPGAYTASFSNSDRKSMENQHGN